MALLTPAASGQAAAMSKSAEATDETCDFAALGATAGIEFRIKGDAHHYRTTGTGTVICRETGKEYDLCERLVERNSGRDIFVAAVDFGPAQMFIPGSERDQVVPPANPDSKIIPITNVMTRRECFETLHSFQDGRPADPYRPYMDFCIEHGLFEIFTKEYIEALAAYLDGRIKQLTARLKRPVKILEIGAGDGKLTHFLTEELRKRGVDTFRMFATDGGNPGEDMHLQPLYPVIDERHDEALWDFEPDIVVCSWMMRNMDLTREIRQTPTVDEYILIGPTDIGTCGQLWETWGKGSSNGEVPPYEQDGFGRVELDDLSKLQICQKDSPHVRHSQTVSFRRQHESQPAEIPGILPRLFALMAVPFKEIGKYFRSRLLPKRSGERELASSS